MPSVFWHCGWVAGRWSSCSTWHAPGDRLWAGKPSRCSRLHELTPCQSIQNALPCRRQTEIEWVQTADRPQPFSTRFASLYRFYITSLWRTPNAGLKSLSMVLTCVCTTKMANERQAPKVIRFKLLGILSWLL